MATGLRRREKDTMEDTERYKGLSIFTDFTNHLKNVYSTAEISDMKYRQLKVNVTIVTHTIR